MKKEKISKIALILNILIIIFELIGLIMAAADGRLQLIYYTEDSNLLALISSTIYVIWYFLKSEKLKKVLHLLKYTTVTSLFLTFLVVLFILPNIMEGSLIYFLTGEEFIFHHTICPIICIVSFVFFEKYEKFSIKDILRAFIFPIIYTSFIMPLNIFRVIEGPYPFLMVYNQPVIMTILWQTLMAVCVCIIALILGKLNNKFVK